MQTLCLKDCILTSERTIKTDIYKIDLKIFLRKLIYTSISPKKYLDFPLYMFNKPKDIQILLLNTLNSHKRKRVEEILKFLSDIFVVIEFEGVQRNVEWKNSRISFIS